MSLECDGCDQDPWRKPVHYGTCPLAPGNVTEKQYLVCFNCGEAFDSITTAHEHGTADPSGSAGWCGDDGFSIVPESEAF